MPNCAFPCCNFHAGPSGFCMHHPGYKIDKNGEVSLSDAPKEEKKPSIAKRGEKLKEAFKGYKKQVKAFLSRPENLKCKINQAGCKQVSECVHHAAGRTGEKLKDEKDWIPSCTSCNQWVEENDAEARRLGFKKSRITKPSKQII